MKHLTNFLAAIVAVAALASSVPAEECPLFPVPKQWTDLNSQWTLEKTVIVVSLDGLSEREKTSAQFAAQRLQTHVKNRFKQTLPILTDPQAAAEYKTVLRLSVQPKENGKFNGFAISFTEADGVNTANVVGNDANGLIYGADVLFDLMSKGADGAIVLKKIQVEDWPSIPYRGRPHFVMMENLVPGALDAYTWARINYIDVRDNPTYKVNDVYPNRAAPMGFMPGVAIDNQNVSMTIREAHRRGMFVYGCVAAATTKKAGGIIAGFDKISESGFYDEVNKTFEQLIDLGCDGLWLSFDDIGKGSDPKSAVKNFLELGKKHGITGRSLAYTPPVGDYQKMDTKFNWEMSKEPGFNEIQWYFTRVPSQGDFEMSKKMGLKLLPAWWHNLIHLRGGFANNGNIAVTLRKGAVDLPRQKADDPTAPYTWETYPEAVPLPAYIELHPLSAGWGAPNYEYLKSAPQYVDNVMLFCIGGGWPEEYLVGMFGIWAWAPETHDWDKMRTSVYSYVYGPEMAQTAREFDDAIVELKSLYKMPVRRCFENKGWPCQLKNPADKDKALAIIAKLESLSKELTQKAPNGSAIDPQRLEYIYLEPMRAVVRYARTMTELEYPDALFAEVKADVAKLKKGELDESQRAELQSKLDRLDAIVTNIETELSDLKIINSYAAHWRKLIKDVRSSVK
ncbi:MAG: hypothetical protein IJQ39_14830 [Thermoguttaceae bacterium]|nr:hypothetical protein [Thermoguttaceae bacterium]